MRYFLALDAGGTKTDCVLADERDKLARVRTGTIKRMRIGADEAHANLKSAFQQLSAQTGVGLQSIAATCVGTSGSSVPLVADWIREAVSSMASGDLIVCGDEEIALDAAFPGGPGVVIIAGTGSNVGGRTRDGRITHTGGWGPALADEGSGHWIGHQALRSAFQAINARHPTLLIDSVLRQWKLKDVAELVARANETPEPDFSSLTQTVVACAEAGDATAIGVLRRGGEELGLLAIQVIEHLRAMEEPDSFILPGVAFTGSVVRHIALLREAMVGAIRRAHPGIRILPEAVDPVDGALWRARNAVR